ncbi:GNAT family N-acetyltransferase [Herbiconiux sp. 11R-BC]|uniref:GNAT family N-acetyltransferase n=1 Tax=Herbiconiux sp. 11R-BC TaxID=3111637 RepID=UPI003C0954F4
MTGIQTNANTEPPAGSSIGTSAVVSPEADADSAPGLILRHARPTEYELVGALTERSFAAGPYGHFARSPERERLERDAGARARSGALLVAVDADGAVVGSATLVRPGTPESRLATTGEAELRLLVVDPSRQRSGAGAALVRACIAEARRWGANAVVLDTGSLNSAAQRLYERTGFDRLTDRPVEPYAPDAPAPLVYRLALDIENDNEGAGANAGEQA